VVPKGIVGEVWQIINREFVDKTYNDQDWLQIGSEFSSKEFTENEEARATIRAMLARLGEPGTRYLEPEQLTSTIQELSGQLAGVGFTNIWLRETAQEIEILNAIADSPAFRAGLRPHDIIQSINGTDTGSLGLEGALMRTRGGPNTPVRLKLRRGDQTFYVNLRREVLGRRCVRSTLQVEQGKAIGYIALSQFAVKSPDQLRDTLKALLNKSVTGFVLDLRNNPGGLIPACREIAGIFLGEKLMCYSTDRAGVAHEVNAIGPRLSEKPLVVLVNGASASASEILAGALRDSHHAVLVGSTTFGQGLVYSVRRLSDHSGLIVAIARLKTPAGREIEHRGLKPDYVVENSEPDFRPDQIATPEDGQYAQAVTVLLRHMK
jgi:carboxyl-terminal processing protease